MVQLSVTVDDEHAVDEVAAGLRARGMEVAQVLEGIGVITGSATDAVRHALAEVEGVASVDEQLTHQLPPPDADIQ
jgi:translation elongation factor EF-1beta